MTETAHATGDGDSRRPERARAVEESNHARGRKQPPQTEDGLHDLYIIHRFEESASVEETLEALNDLVRHGKVLYLGASSMHVWQFAKCLHLQRQKCWSPLRHNAETTTT
jgi:diketogulonate reductase-like aldo/keto reductase